LQADTLEYSARPLTGDPADYDPLLELIGQAHYVLIGEATHGTHEFYRERAEITKRLIQEKGFNAVTIEGDFPDAYRVNRYVRGTGDGENALEALAGFKRFPAWMWRNTVVLDFVRWLRAYNDRQPMGQKAGFYGLDLYSLYTSIEAVLNYLDRNDPEAAKRARYRYRCLEHFNEDPQAYGYAANFDLTESCEQAVVEELVEMQRQAVELARRDGMLAKDEYFFAEQNARVVKNAEQYYRTMFRGHVASWNLRDRHMVETLNALAAHVKQLAGESKIVVWAHNSHLGDARATEMGRQGEWNVGQLARERYERDCRLIGMTTHHGTVTAAFDWDEPAERKRVRPALKGSYEELFHHLRREDADLAQFYLNLRDLPLVERELDRSRLERAIGVIYRPETERLSHYFEAKLGDQFDAILHFDETRALEPLERTSQWEQGEPPETYPTGI
jgi:erythromycin esterase-like protein